MKRVYTKTIGALTLAAAILIGQPSFAEAKLGDKSLSYGVKHKDVTDLQKALKKTGHFTYPTYTNYYGTYTKTAVSGFQKQNKLKVTGVADTKTIQAITKKAATLKSLKPVAAASSFDPDFALSLQGVRYRMGGTSPSTGFDCSGYVRYVMNEQGVSLPRTSREMFQRGTPAMTPQPGDLVFYDTNSNGKRDVSHVSIYLGNSRIIHAAGSQVKIDSMGNSYWNPRYMGAKKVL
ncbi:C40 family peptidase [Fictibacillus iocasae]|uniref:C40 family peptidase n=1 Tax=Fictibacillus iocasae TaxID=2715437 RepID=A0ABW2NL39_9BACL